MKRNERPKGQNEEKEDKTTKNTDFPKYFLRPLSGPLRPLSGLFSGVSGRGAGENFSGPGPERAGENPKNHFNMALAVWRFHGRCRIAPAYCFDTRKIFSLKGFVWSGVFSTKKALKREQNRKAAMKTVSSEHFSLLFNMFCYQTQNEKFQFQSRQA